MKLVEQTKRVRKLPMSLPTGGWCEARNIVTNKVSENVE